MLRKFSCQVDLDCLKPLALTLRAGEIPGCNGILPAVILNVNLILDPALILITIYAKLNRFKPLGLSDRT